MTFNRITSGLALTAYLTSAALAEQITIGNTVPFSDVLRIQPAIVNECNLPVKQAELLEKAAMEKGITVVREANVPKSGKYLKLSIENAMSSGNAFIGHSKSVTVKGTLFDNGVEVGDFIDTRHSMGGAFAAYKGSCSVLGRCSEAIANDVVAWLSNPTKGTRLGD